MAREPGAGVGVSPTGSPISSKDDIPADLPRVINHLIDSPAAWEVFDTQLRGAHPDRTLLAIDAEWHQDVLCLVQVAFSTMSASRSAPGARGRQSSVISVHTIDCLCVPAPEIFRRLQPLWSDVRLRKLAFDCREDCRMLQEQLDVVNPAGLLDLQLLEIATREESARGRKPICNVRGLKTLLKEFPSLARFVAAKTGQDLHAIGSSSVFMDRPLPRNVLDYASCDVAALFTLFGELQSRPLFRAAPGRVLDEVVRGSIVYSTLSLVVPPEFRRHNMLPLAVLDSLAPAQGSRACDGCLRPVAPRDRDMCVVCFMHSRRVVGDTSPSTASPTQQGQLYDTYSSHTGV